MFKKFALFATLLLLCVSCAFAEEAEVTGMMMEEPELDITELIEIAEEEKAREKKDSDGAYIMTVTCTGDFTIGGDTYHHKDLFTPELERHGGDINFVMENVRSLFMDDDLTLLNFEGTLTDTKSVPSSKRNNEFLFSITPSAVSVLPDNGVEAVSLDNNHVRDHGEEGLADTKAALDSAGVLYSTPLDLAVFNYKDQIQVAMLSYNCIDRYGTSFKKHPEEYSASFLAHGERNPPAPIPSRAISPRTTRSAWAAWRWTPGQTWWWAPIPTGSSPLSATTTNISSIPSAISALPETASPGICPP